MLKEELLKELRIRSRIIHEMQKAGVSDIMSVQRMINDYYRDPAKVKAEFGINE